MRIQLKTRTIMIMTCIAAVLLVLPGELRNRRKRRHLARIKVYCLDQAAIEEQLRATCVASAGRVPYDALFRDQSPPHCKDWDTEADWHARMVKHFLEKATINEQLEQSVRRRLLLPVLFDIRSSRR